MKHDTNLGNPVAPLNTDDATAIYMHCISTTCKHLAYGLTARHAAKMGGEALPSNPDACGAHRMLAQILHLRRVATPQMGALRDALNSCTSICQKRLKAFKEGSLEDLKEYNRQALGQASAVRQTIMAMTRS